MIYEEQLRIQTKNLTGTLFAGNSTLGMQEFEVAEGQTLLQAVNAARPAWPRGRAIYIKSSNKTSGSGEKRTRVKKEVIEAVDVELTGFELYEHILNKLEGGTNESQKTANI